jgi:hypothetical protein
MVLVRRILGVLAFLCTLVVGVASMAIVVSQTTWFKDWLRGFIVREAGGYVNGRVNIGRITGNLAFGVQLDDIDVTMAGTKVVELKSARIDYSPSTFLAGHVVLDAIRLNAPIVRLAKTRDGWNIAHLMKPRPPTSGSRAFEIRELDVTDASVYVAGPPEGSSAITVPEIIDHLNASLGVRSDADQLRVALTRLSLRARHPELGISTLSGRIIRTHDGWRFDQVALRTDASSLTTSGLVRTAPSTPTLDLHASADPLALDEIAAIVPSLRNYPLHPSFLVTANGPLNRLNVVFEAHEPAVGEVKGSLVVNTEAPDRGVSGDLSVRHFNLAPVVRNARATSDIVGRGHIDLAFPDGTRPLRGTYSTTVSHVSVSGYTGADVKATGRIDGANVRLHSSALGYGAEATADGTVRVGSPVQLDLTGHARHVDMRHVPRQLHIPAAPSNLEFDYSLSVRGPVFSGQLRFDSSTLADAAIAPGTSGTFRFGSGAPTYTATGSASHLDMQAIGQAFSINALRDDRFHSRVNGAFTICGSGGGRFPFNFDGSGVLTDSTVFGATVPRLDVWR